MADDALSAALEEIRARETAATPGPWGWFGNTDTQSIYLATRRWGRFTVMGFRRWGMHGARPTFAVNRTWKPAPESDADFGAGGRMIGADGMFMSPGEMDGADAMPVFEVAPNAVTRKDPRVYRADLTGLRNPDAEFIAHSRQDLSRLLAAVSAALDHHHPRQLYAMTENYKGETVCGHDQDYDGDRHFEGDDGLWYCKDKPTVKVCETCCDGSATDLMAPWPCPEYEAILAALTGEEKSGA